MMLDTLRARLWLSYALLIGITVAVVSVALIVSLLRNPAVYRQSVLPQLRLVEAQIMPRLKLAIRVNGAPNLQDAVDGEAKSRKNIRIAIVDSNGIVVADSGKKTDGALPAIDPSSFPHLRDTPQLGLVRDARKKTWVYWTNQIGQSEYTLIVGTTLPRLALVQLLRNEVAAPLIWSGGVALLAAFLLAVFMGSWISLPLQQMAAVSVQMAAGKRVEIPEQGPREVQDLARALNVMHRQVQVSQNSQRDFIANVSHELKTPLTSIKGFAQAILDGAVQTPESLDEAATVIFSESNRMHRLVVDLLTLTRLEGGTADLRHERLDLRSLLNGVVTNLTPQAASAGVQLAIEVGECPAVTGDGDRLAQVFSNLLDNAIKFSPSGGRIGLITRLENVSIVVEVRDHGKGFPPEDKERIFERFYQLDKSRRGGVDHGVGLGLPIARQIIEAHGGKIWAESQPGTGSQFFVRLPTVLSDGSHEIVKKNK